MTNDNNATILEAVDTLSHVRAKVDFICGVFASSGGDVDYLSGNALSGLCFVLENVSNDVAAVEKMLDEVREG